MNKMKLCINWSQIRFKRYLLIKIIIIIISITFLYNVVSKYFSRNKRSAVTPTVANRNILYKYEKSQKMYNDKEYRRIMYERKIEKLTRKVMDSHSIHFTNLSFIRPHYNIHVFYYAWYGNLKYDKHYYHWNHEFIPNWKKTGNVLQQKAHEAPLDIGSNFYPALGCYSSRDPNTIQMHMKQIRSAGIGVVVVSWSPPNMKDSPHDILPFLFHYANEQHLRITIHIEPYVNRNPRNLRRHLIAFLKNYHQHPALYKIKLASKSVSLPVLYVYDSYLSPSAEWKELLHKNGNITIRDSKYDAVFIGLLVDVTHRFHIKKSGFDGFYTYFATNGFTYGSTWKNWMGLSKFAKQSSLIFIPSVGPGYIDIRIRPWNAVSTRHRRNGQYYDVAWRAAISSSVEYISITSFNEWHEGTQIEPAVSKAIPDFTYLDYSPEKPAFYLNLTKWWIQQFFKKKNTGL